MIRFFILSVEQRKQYDYRRQFDLYGFPALSYVAHEQYN